MHGEIRFKARLSQHQHDAHCVQLGTVEIEGTAPLSRRQWQSVVVGNLFVEVTEGPDKGVRAETEDETLTIGTGAGNFLVLSDPTVSRYHLQLRRTATAVEIRDLGSTNGTQVGAVQIRNGVIPPNSQLVIGKSALTVGFGRGGVVEALQSYELESLLGASETMRRLMAKLQRIGTTSVPVLLLGESGTGKELAARALHAQSPRCNGPFVVVDCGSLNPQLFASELFGHERGAFPSAERQHIGALERANNGTLFLDEVGELPSDLQLQLLGAIDRGRFYRVGGHEEVIVDVRVVSATNRDLREEVNSNAFRSELFYRIGVITLDLPPLRERLDDIPLLVEHFLREAGHAGEVAEIVPEATIERLKSYRWPGNVRELRNWVEATLAIGEAEAPVPRSLPPLELGFEELVDLPYKDARGRLLDKFEKEYCEHLMTSTKGNVSKAARVARMDRSYLIKLLQRHQLK